MAADEQVRGDHATDVTSAAADQHSHPLSSLPRAFSRGQCFPGLLNVVLVAAQLRRHQSDDLCLCRGF